MNLELEHVVRLGVPFEEFEEIALEAVDAAFHFGQSLRVDRESGRAQLPARRRDRLEGGQGPLVQLDGPLSDRELGEVVEAGGRVPGPVDPPIRRLHLEHSQSGHARYGRVDLVLLDFLAYQNRGWSEYAVKTHEIGSRISELYDKIRNPILANLRYQFAGVSEKEVYPKHLPDFYQNAEFVVYGKFREEDQFSMRVLGDIDGTTKEFIFARHLTNAEVGTREIAERWAFNKFYYLISQITLEGPSESLKRDLDQLRKEFKIQSPYDF